MTGKASRGPGDTVTPQTPGMPIRLVRGSASPEEISAVIALVAVLAAADSDDDPGEIDSAAPGRGTSSRSPWSAPARMVRGTHSPGPGGWRASASPR
ncbi:MAG TPA: acyl-CoA carboxylase epsilon subunit [Dermatophilaceae bacterium]